MAQNAVSDPATPSDAPSRGVAPADAKPRAPWPSWKIVLAYVAMFGVAIGSIWVIDGHVLQATPSPSAPATTQPR